jgi:anaerobic selenocysteine-containing dehydrogenase
LTKIERLRLKRAFVYGVKVYVMFLCMLRTADWWKSKRTRMRPERFGRPIRVVSDVWPPRSIFIIQNVLTLPRTDSAILARFLEALGSPNTCSQGQICFFPRLKVAHAIVGYHPEMSIRPETQCIVLLGVEPQIAHPYVANNMREARKNGAKMIVLDPRCTKSASEADIWLQVRPGTDCALLLSMVNVVINGDLYDKEFVEKWCHGFEEVKKRVGEYSPEQVTNITGIPVQRIREAARMYARHSPACFAEGMGIEHSTNNTEALHARWILAAITNNIDIPGGEYFAGLHPQIHTHGQLKPPVFMPKETLRKQIASDRFRFFSWQGMKLVGLKSNQDKVFGRKANMLNCSHAPSIWRTILSGDPYPIRGMLTFANNPMITFANTKLVHKALKSLDLYVVSDFFMTPSAALADYVLPSACWLEVPYLYDRAGYNPGFSMGEACLPSSIPGEYEHKDDYEIFKEILIRLGKGDLFPWKTREDYYSDMLEPMGMTHNEAVHKVIYAAKPKEYKKYEKGGFATPTGKIELYSTVFEKLGYDPLPKYREPAETPVSHPDQAKDYPFRLLTGARTREYYHSEWRQIDSIRKIRPYPQVQIHPDTAETLGIENGDWVWIETQRGRIRQKAMLFDGIDPDVVHAEHGWWYPELPQKKPWLHGVWESNVNVLTNDDPEICNEITGGWPLKTALCKIYKVKEGETQEFRFS